MALRTDAANEHAHAPNPWSGGDFTIAFWMHRVASSASNRFLSGLLDTDDATPESSGDPRVTINTASTQSINGMYFGNGASTNDSLTSSYSSTAWNHIAVRFNGTGSTLTSVEVFVNGTGTGSPGTSSRDLSVNGVLDRLQIGSNTTNHSNSDFAHWAYFNSSLSGSQITELQTKLPTAITGASPIIYYDLISATTNGGSGGSTYDLTLSGAALNSANDGTLPALSGGGGTTYSQSLSSSLTLSGSPYKLTEKFTFSSSITAASTAASNVVITQGVVGSLTASGSLSTAALFARFYGSTIALSGGIVRAIERLLTGSIGLTGSLYKLISRNLFSSLTLSSILNAFKFTPAPPGTILSNGIRFMRKFLGRR